MAAEIKDDLDVEPKLTQGDRGIFDVRVDGKLVFSKFKTGRFPDAGEILHLI